MLWKYGPVLAMGAAAGRDSRHHHRGYAYLFVGGTAAYTPAYTYTWKQAVEDGAGTNTYDPGPPPSALCNVPVAHRAEAGRRVTGDREGALQRRRGRPRARRLRAWHRDPAVPRVGQDARAWGRVFGSPSASARARSRPRVQPRSSALKTGLVTGRRAFRHTLGGQRAGARCSACRRSGNRR